jgi:hypothetical protein
MEQIQNYGSVTVDLSGSDSPATSVTKTATYDQAFLGENFSDAKGKFRAKRKAKKLTKIADKQEVKQARKGGRQEARLARRTTRKTTRQDIRGGQQEARMTRRNKRDEQKATRRGGDVEETEEEEVDTTTIDPEADYSESEDNGYADSESEDDGYSESEDDGYSESEDNGYSEEDDSYSEDEDLFNGEQSNFVSELTGGVKVPPMVDTICMKIEWNNEMISRLMSAKEKMASKGQDTSKVTDALGQKFDRVQQLEKKLENFSGANGMPDAQKQRAVGQARTRARNQRMQNVIPPVLVANMVNKGYSKSQIKNWWNTKGKNKIAQSSFYGTSDDFGRGMQPEQSVDVAYWEAPVYDNNEAQPVSVELGSTNEKSSSFIGGGSISWKPILIGAVIGFVAIYAIRKYKLLK